jgi:hypothetical protein
MIRLVGSQGAQGPTAGRWHAAGLSILLVLFVFRVAAQLVQSLWPTRLLPPFAAWQSGLVPYGILVAAQALIILVIALIIISMVRQRLRPRRKLGIALLALGAVYMLGAAFRLAAGMSFLSHLLFFRATLPSIFHIVLAGIVLTLGHVHFRGNARLD